MTPRECLEALRRRGYVALRGGANRYSGRFVVAVQELPDYPVGHKPLGCRAADIELLALTEQQRLMLATTGTSKGRTGR